MPPLKLEVRRQSDEAQEQLGALVILSDSKSGLDVLQLADASNAVALYGICILLSAFLLVLGTSLCLYYRGLATTLSGVTTLGLLVLTRHIYILRRRNPIGPEAVMQKSAPDLSHLPAVSYLYVMGSGGHTAEMGALVKLSFKVNKNQHRRYIITLGDENSINQEKTIESLVHKSCPDGSGGTHDTFIVTRARKVHQSYLTSVYSSLRCGLDILAALTMIPAQRAGKPNAAAFRFPHVIVTNGPGTGFIVGLMAHILKVLYLAPQDRLKIVFVETWARTHSLGLTGKLFYWLGITDLFVVQSETLSKTLGKPNIGNLNAAWSEASRQKLRSMRKTEGEIDTQGY
ncbi:UDP-N-acetylglucosamine transferase subunit alg14 [Cytospora mali]|uniref:UDP-N-acetylglucosamine transferase subunit ALG14 n=1 Tax=Cytospora mali TaxID=578113 RepID=A0A194VGY2_CYTMA|nr:UDP-N-acetylglucosamine transferase subunit alg14 [Valsa mali var. pyri (nom. inval.)]